ncbi:MAG: hypothetical protein MR015_06665, partial [Clostridiales bacterium]|nr:hypothetical protein [Clostridiales bacterium]
LAHISVISKKYHNPKNFSSTGYFHYKPPPPNSCTSKYPLHFPAKTIPHTICLSDRDIPADAASHITHKTIHSVIIIQPLRHFNVTRVS